MQVIKFTIPGRGEFYCKSEGLDEQKLLTLIDADRNGRPGHQVDIIEMPEEEYSSLQTTNESVEFFAPVSFRELPF